MKIQEPFPDPPDHLSPRSKTLWNEIGPDSAQSVQRRVLFQTALECLDRADQARELVKMEGLTTTTKTTGALHINPLVKLEKEAIAQFVKIWGLLHLQWNSAIDGRVL
jgi:phage terminase small subunit